MRKNWAHIAYHWAAGGEGEHLLTGYLSVRGEGLITKEWKVNMTPAAFGCIMADNRIHFRPVDTISSLSLAEAKVKKEGGSTPAQDFAHCMRYLREGGEPTPPDQFNCLALAPGSRGHELLGQLREGLETEGRHTARWSGPKWNKGQMINVLFRSAVGLLRENANLEAQLRTVGMESLEQAARGSEQPLQNGFHENKKKFENEGQSYGGGSMMLPPSALPPGKGCEKMGTAHGEWLATSPSLAPPHDVMPTVGPSTEVTSPEHPPPYEGGKLYPSLPAEGEQLYPMTPLREGDCIQHSQLREKNCIQHFQLKKRSCL
ncbi:uncharacterized protein LOC109281620 [Alligator mississippiensis]|uniref:uncharacterized protein LOC109281620 n=1 Tax=Alligator mississippiensis TaxID=8496 RepID=UPI002877E4B3|nr:uncharacterized protein LOC109281620 [Alligator mississippiensis]XP_059577839.1 uncharacterized protein LOC109281620 [Alligator mississippiensis]